MRQLKHLDKSFNHSWYVMLVGSAGGHPASFLYICVRLCLFGCRCVDFEQIAKLFTWNRGVKHKAQGMQTGSLDDFGK